MDKKHNEFKVAGTIVKGVFKIDKKEPTERKFVMISERDAVTNNRQSRFNFLHYELDKKTENARLKAIEDAKTKEK